MELSGLFIIVFSLFYGKIEGGSTGQTACMDLDAVLLPEVYEELLANSWWVDKVTKMNDKPKGFDETTNTCSSLSHVEGCGAIRTFREVDSKNPKQEKAKVYAYYKHTKNIVRYEIEYTQTDDKYPIYSGKVTSMRLIYEGGKVEDVVPNDFVKEVHSEEYAVIYAHEDGRFTINRSCDKKLTWVQLLDTIVAEADKYERDELDKQIMKKLKELNVDTEKNLNDPEEKFPFLVAYRNAN